jgi:hypothetical protein
MGGTIGIMCPTLSTRRHDRWPDGIRDPAPTTTTAGSVRATCRKLRITNPFLPLAGHELVPSELWPLGVKRYISGIAFLAVALHDQSEISLDTCPGVGGGIS